MLYWAGSYLGHPLYLTPQIPLIFKRPESLQPYLGEILSHLNLHVSCHCLILSSLLPKSCLMDLELSYLNFMPLGKAECKILTHLLKSFLSFNPFISFCVPHPCFHCLPLSPHKISELQVRGGVWLVCIT